MSPELFADVARIMAEVAAREVMPRWRNLGAGDVAEKAGPDDLVTIADQACERALAERLASLLPGSAVVGEEAAAADPGVLGKLRRPGPVWVIDPIDGTLAFASGEPDFTLMVALVEDGQSKAGWILAPAFETILFGGVGHGVRQGSSPADALPVARPPLPGEVGAMTGLLGKRNITPERRAELQAKERHFRALDAVLYAGVDYMRLAGGSAHFALYSKSEPWDHLPGLAILGALGFTAAKHDGTPYRPGDNQGGLIVAPDAASLEAIRRLLLG